MVKTYIPTRKIVKLLFFQALKWFHKTHIPTSVWYWSIQNFTAGFDCRKLGMSYQQMVIKKDNKICSAILTQSTEVTNTDMTACITLEYKSAR